MDVLLFPLINVTLFPRTTKPLNIFEPKYLEMIRDSVKNQKPVALAFIEDAANVREIPAGEEVPFVRSIAGYGTAQIIEERANGTVLSFVHGQGKCRLGKVKKSDTLYMICDAEVIVEDKSVDESLQPQIQGLNKILARWITAHIPDATQRELFLENLDGPEEIIGAFSAYLIRDYDLQQIVLEFDSLNEKIKFLHRLAESGEITI